MHNINKTATITPYLVENTTNKLRPAILILPGGSYLYTSKREGRPVATAFNNAGIHSFVLDYTTFTKNEDITVEEMIQEVNKAYNYIIGKSKEFQVDVNKIYIIGFSAGGHLAAEVINRYPNHYKKAILSYPALKINIKTDRTDKEVDFVRKAFKNNPTNQLTNKVPPVFIWHTYEDETVPIEGSIEYVLKLNELKVPFEAHFFEKGAHGLSVATEVTATEENERMDLHAANWVMLASNWSLRND